MAVKYMTLAKKLQTVCNNKFGVRILINTNQWYSLDQDRAVTQYKIMQVVKNDEKGKDISIELFKTYSQVQLVLFLRDFWYELNGWEVPHDNETWENIKNNYGRAETTHVTSNGAGQ